MKIIDKYITFNNEKYIEMYIINSVKKIFRRAAKVNNRKGFTLAELLIVVAIIAVLIVVAIPIFVNQLEKSREASDLANVRSAYAEVMASVIEGDTSKTVSVELSQRESDWLNDPVTIGSITHYKKDGDTVNWNGVPGNKGTCVVSYNEGTGILFTWSGASNVVKPTVKYGSDVHEIVKELGYTETYKENRSFEIDSDAKNSTMLPAIMDKINDDDILKHGSWAYLADFKGSTKGDIHAYLLWTSVDVSVEGAGVDVPVIVSKADGSFYISSSTTANRIKNTTGEITHIAISDHILNKNGYKKFTEGKKYASFEEAYEDYRKLVVDKYPDFKDTLPV